MTSQGRILVTGSREWTDRVVIRFALAAWRRGYPTGVLVHGGARGADRIAAGIWQSWGLPVEAHPADWSHNGRSAGFTRNQALVTLGADVCLAFIHQGSRGASHTAALADRAAIPTYRFRSDDSDMLTRVWRTSINPGYALIGPREQVYRIARHTTIEPAPVVDREARLVHQLLNSGSLSAGSVREYHCGPYSGAGRAVFATYYPKRTNK